MSSPRPVADAREGWYGSEGEFVRGVLARPVVVVGVEPEDVLFDAGVDGGDHHVTPRELSQGVPGSFAWLCLEAFARGVGVWYGVLDRKSTRLNSSHRCISY